MKAMFLAVFTAIVAMSFSLPAQASLTYGQLSGIPAKGTITYVTWHGSEFPPKEILTEDGINPDAGTDQGYDGKYFRIEARNFSGNPNSGSDGIVCLAGVASELGKATKNIPYKWGTGNPNDDNLGTLDFLPSDRPLPPVQPKTMFLKRLGGILVSWGENSSASFLVYKSSLFSGAGNGHSNGRYKLVAQTAKNWFFDKDMVQSSVWYVIVGIDGEKMGGHSEESNELSLVGVNAAPKKSLSLPTRWGEIKR